MYFTECQATKPQNISYNITEDYINISWVPPDNTYQRNIVNYVVFVGNKGDNVTQRPTEHLETDDRFTVVSRL